MNTKNATADRPATRRWIWVILALLVVAALVGYGIWSRSAATDRLRKTADVASIPDVQTTQPQRGPAQQTLMLPGSLVPWYQASIYGQVTGYVSHWYKDFGANVKAGEVLAKVSSPSANADLAAAKAQLATTRANYNLAVVTAKRWTNLAGTQAVAQQDVDIKIADEKAQHAQVQAAQQNVNKYKSIAAFENIVAPFAGVVTARMTNIGDFVSAQGAVSNSRVPAQPLFTVADMRRLRVFVAVPQTFAISLAHGLVASVTFPQNPATRIPVQFLTTAGAVNPVTRSVVMEFTLDNAKSTYLPGSFVNVHLEFPSNPDILIVPQQSLLFGAQGMQVAIVGTNSKVHLQDVIIGENLGSQVQVISGLTANDHLIASPSLGILEGQQVRVVKPTTKPGGQAGAGK